MVHIWTRCFLVVREQEFEGTSVSGCRRGDDEVEDGAEVVGRDEGCFGWAEGDIRQVGAEGNHEGWSNVVQGECAAFGAWFATEAAGGDDGERVDWRCCGAGYESSENWENKFHCERANIFFLEKGGCWEKGQPRRDLGRKGAFFVTLRANRPFMTGFLRPGIFNNSSSEVNYNFLTGSVSLTGVKVR
jgi:hypothetical protein